MSKEIMMEDVGSISLAAMQVIEDQLKEFGITMTPEQEDLVFIPMRDAIERIAGCPDYRHHH
jgi:hypothetical protein